MNFGEATERMRAGERLTHPGYDAGTFFAIQSVDERERLLVSTREGERGDPWLSRDTDLLRDDWIVFNPPELEVKQEPEQNTDSEQVAKVKHNGHDLLYAIPNSLCAWRVKTLFTKEPETLKWINTFKPGELFVDVGANVGMYTIYAAVTRGVSVVALEPEAQNFAVLNRNILFNNLVERVKAYPIAMGEMPCEPTILYLAQFAAGGSCHRIDEELNWKGEKTEAVFTQGAVRDTLDNFFGANPALSTAHIKIDVDGIESDIIKGMGDLRPKSLCIEVNPKLEDHRDMVTALQGMGYEFDVDQVNRATRKEGAFEGVAEYVFHRT